jgi:alpha-beta hydrolase superfamily lysophospholipase
MSRLNFPRNIEVFAQSYPVGQISLPNVLGLGVRGGPMIADRLEPSDLARRTLGTLISLILLSSFSPPVMAQVFNHPSTGEETINAAAARNAELANDRADLIPISAFYDAKQPLEPWRPGELIRSEAAIGLQLPSGVSAIRILYRSVSPAGQPVAASGLVLIPAGPPPAGGWPVIAWAHGTTGVTRPCAPSLMKDIGYYAWAELSTLVDMGYAVVATDYQGLGTATGHPWADKITNAQDTIYSVPAAHAAVKNLSTRWVVMGHSQGGLTAASVGELEHSLKDPSYLGSVAIAAPLDLEKVFGRMDAPDADSLNNAYLVLLARSLPATYPNFTPDQILTPAAMKRLQEAGDHCVAVDMAFTFDLPRGEVVKANWRSNSTVQAFFKRNAMTGPIAGPMLILASTDDESVPATTQDDAVARLCAGGAAIDYVRYAGFGLDHDGIERATTGLRLRWIHDRFAGLPARTNCSSLKALK